jgi:hypothetical protein
MMREFETYFVLALMGLMYACGFIDGKKRRTRVAPECDSDQNPQGEDPKGLSAKHESAVPSGNRPETPAIFGFGEPLND